MLKLVDENSSRAEADALAVDDEVARIRHEFEAVRQGFHKVPEALQSMPKMNPKGLSGLVLFPAYFL